MKRLIALASLPALLFGGFSLLLDASIPSVPTGTWAPAPSAMLSARSGASGALLSDGRVLVTGGLTGDPASPGVHSSAELFGIDGAFAPAAPMSIPRTRHASVTLQDGRVLVTGGITAGGEAVASAEFYNPSTDTWSSAGEMAEVRSGHTASLLGDGRVLIAGGSSLEIFDPSTGSFSFAGALLPARTDHAAAVLQDGRVLIAGGSSETGASTRVDVYEDGAGLVALGDMSTARAALSATTMLDGGVLLVGGRNEAGDLASAEAYYPASGSLTPAFPLSVPRSGHQAFLLPHNNNVLIVGGTSAGAASASAELYVPWRAEVRATGPMAAPRTGGVGSALAQDGVLLVAGGENGNGYQAGAEVYGFATVNTDKDDYAPSETVTITGSGWQPGETVTMLLHEASHPLAHEDLTLTAVANEAGSIVNTEFAPEEHDIGVRFYLTASGAGSEAQTTFTDAELVTAEVTGTLNDVGIVQGGAPVGFSVSLEATGNISAAITSSNPSTAKVNTTYTFSGGTLSSSDLSTPLNFFASSTGCTGSGRGGGPVNCDVTWTGAPTPYSVSATVQANAATAANNYTITLSDAANTTEIANPIVAGGKLADATATSITVHVRLAAPSGLTASPASQTQVNLQWLDNSTGEDNFIVQSSANMGGPFTTIATLPPGTANYTDATLTCNTTPYYQVRAAKTSPIGLDSDFSNVASATTNACDTTPPVITPTITGTLGNNGWYVSDVKVTWDVSDPESSIASTSGCDETTISVDTTGTTLTCTATSAGGTSSNSVTIKRDATKPTASASASPASNANGWNNTDVTVTFSGTDVTSGIASCDTPVVLSSEGTGQSASGSCADDAGNVSDPATASGIRIDKTKPMITGDRTPAPNAFGWNNTDVTVSFTCTDGLSGVDTNSVAGATVTTEGAAQSVTNTGTCTDEAGNVADSGTVSGINIDKTPPSIGGSRTPAPNANGWNNTDVTIEFICSDDLSGIDSCGPSPQVASAEGAGQSRTGTATDKAGNSAEGTVSGINIDKTPPEVTTTRTPSPNGNGWNNTDVQVHFTATDALSGVDGDSFFDALLTLEGMGQSASHSFTDLAGNTASHTESPVNIDKTPPVISASLSPANPAPTGWYNIATGVPTVNFVCSDTLSGLDGSCPGPYTFLDGADQSQSRTIFDEAGNSASAGVQNVDVDTEKPAINMITPPNGATYVLNSAMPANYSCSDATSGVATCAGPVASGANVSTNPVGPHSFSVNAMDVAGNLATPVTHSYNVQYAPAGTACVGAPGHTILQPIDSTGASVFQKKQGSTAPAKFRICDANGVSVGNPGSVVTDFRIVQASNSTASTYANEEPASTTPDTAFRWDATGMQWIYNISTKPLYAGSTYYFRIWLNDGTWIDFQFGLK